MGDGEQGYTAEISLTSIATARHQASVWCNQDPQVVELLNHQESSIFDGDLDPITESEDEGQGGEGEEKSEANEEQEGKPPKRKYDLVIPR